MKHSKTNTKGQSPQSVWHTDDITNCPVCNSSKIEKSKYDVADFGEDTTMRRCEDCGSEFTIDGDVKLNAKTFEKEQVGHTPGEKTMTYKAIDIEYDTDGEKIELPKTLDIEVEDNLSPDEKLEYISDEISNRTGYCHFGFNTIPEIDKESGGHTEDLWLIDETTNGDTALFAHKPDQTDDPCLAKFVDAVGADMQLIKAAPDLLKSLKSIKSQILAMEQNEKTTDEQRKILNEMFHTTREAIIKATL